MFQKITPLFIICETPLHAGSGSDLGIVDMPIQREKHTGFPKIESSSFKGAIREAVEGIFIKKATDELSKDAQNEVKMDALKTAEKRKNPIVTTLFGPEDAGNDAHMGALGFSDARLLLFPVKSMKGIFAWVTCPKVLDQFKRDMKLVVDGFDISGNYSIEADGLCKLLNESESTLKVGTSILLEEYAFKYQKIELKVDDKSLQEWLSENLPTEWSDKLKKDIVILSNDDFKDFVNLSTEVITRTAIDNEKGTVKPGALFTEEFLPAESVMYSLVMASPAFKENKGNLDTADKVMSVFKDAITNDLKVIQIGGGATLGKGIVRTKIN